MNFKSIAKMDLGRLILALTIASVLVSLANTLHASYQVQRQQLIDAALETNHAYASKLAASTDDFFASMMQQLAYAAQVVARDFDNPALLKAESERLFLQTDSFNSIAIIDRQAQVVSHAPQTLQLLGRKLETRGVRKALADRKPLISQPYLSAAGNLVISVSQPVFDAQRNYLGMIAGTIYLKHENFLNRLLASHYYQDGSYLYVVDQQRRLIYHPLNNRVGTAVEDNLAIEEVIAGIAGRREVTNSEHVAMLAGYAIVPATGWGVVAQRPKTATLAALDTLMLKVLLHALPVAALSLVFIWWCARRIARPLQQLASGARTMDDPATAGDIRRVRSWYYEAAELRQAMLVGIGLLQRNINRLRQDAQTDALTGLGNRRTLDQALAAWEREKTPFAVMSVDVDFFKNVNDTYGHDVGDGVLRALAQHMRDCARERDVFCRIGGEEFLVLLPRTSPQVALQVAERLRQQVERADMAPVGRVTISIGIAHWAGDAQGTAEVFKRADEMLYRAKRAGRNRVEVDMPEIRREA
ncbi:sensor domain-containing diguanylate cyclase [Comamonas antarctica]|uniref:diguanylate cyclase n=1 Tax=Comamonas antarctica TaxID=2743470 RepID=A0A6N1XBM0_9BURK|nr:sensor domain-containing diguanylate cyclase [Comamonas antarctica]QKV55275.1 GGDEF domain-containing protein [Comamonas antarctica]